MHVTSSTKTCRVAVVTGATTAGAGTPGAGTPALVMCVLGCYDACAKRLGEADAPSRLARDVLPVLMPLLDEKALNAKQFEMVATRVEAMLSRVVAARRHELATISAGKRASMSTRPSAESSAPAPRT